MKQIAIILLLALMPVFLLSQILGNQNSLTFKHFPKVSKYDRSWHLKEVLIEYYYSSAWHNGSNPFINSTSVKYNLIQNSKVYLSIYNTKGQLVKTLINGSIKSGSQSTIWNGTDNNNKKVSSGIYVSRTNADSKTISRKMLMLK